MSAIQIFLDNDASSPTKKLASPKLSKLATNKFHALNLKDPKRAALTPAKLNINRNNRLNFSKTPNPGFSKRSTTGIESRLLLEKRSLQESQLKLKKATKQIEDEKFDKIEIDPCTRRAPNFNLDDVEMENLSFIESKSENNEEKENQDDSSLDMTAASFSAFDMELDEGEKENEEEQEEDNYPDYIDTCSRIQQFALKFPEVVNLSLDFDEEEAFSEVECLSYEEVASFTL